MKFGDWLKDIVSVPEDNDEVEETFENEDYEERAESKQSAGKGKIFEKHETARVQPVKPVNNIKVVLAKPETFEEGTAVADHLNQKRTVILNLEGTNRDISRRLIDFLSGVAYANDGQIKRVANCTYIITPRSVDVMGDMILDELENSGLYF